MDLTNKQIKITMTGVGHNPPHTIVDVDVMTVLADGVREKFGSYELTFNDMTSSGPDDPALLAAITERLEAI